MSKPITRTAASGVPAGPGSVSASCAVRAMPTMPPAGPLRIASLPANWPAPVKPPEDCMKYSGTPGISAATWAT